MLISLGESGRHQQWTITLFLYMFAYVLGCAGWATLSLYKSARTLLVAGLLGQATTCGILAVIHFTVGNQAVQSHPTGFFFVLFAVVHAFFASSSQLSVGLNFLEVPSNQNLKLVGKRSAVLQAARQTASAGAILLVWRWFVGGNTGVVGPGESGEASLNNTFGIARGLLYTGLFGLISASILVAFWLHRWLPWMYRKTQNVTQSASAIPQMAFSRSTVVWVLISDCASSMEQFPTIFLLAWICLRGWSTVEMYDLLLIALLSRMVSSVVACPLIAGLHRLSPTAVAVVACTAIVCVAMSKSNVRHEQIMTTLLGGAVALMYLRDQAKAFMLMQVLPRYHYLLVSGLQSLVCGTFWLIGAVVFRAVLNTAETQPWLMNTLLGETQEMPGITGPEGLSKLILAGTLPFAVISLLCSLPLIRHFPIEALF